MESLDEREWMTEDNLQAAKRALLIAELEQRWFPEEIASQIGWYASRGLDPEQGIVGASDLINSVDLQTIQRVWEDYVINTQPTELFIKGNLKRLLKS